MLEKLLEENIKKMSEEIEWKPQKPERLDDFYEELKKIHLNWPDWRFGQFMCNFFEWLDYTYKMDAYYSEEDELLQLLQKFVKAMKPVEKNKVDSND